jgi:hypothetical protein
VLPTDELGWVILLLLNVFCVDFSVCAILVGN